MHSDGEYFLFRRNWSRNSIFAVEEVNMNLEKKICPRSRRIEALLMFPSRESMSSFGFPLSFLNFFRLTYLI